ncbi:MAG: hypothetical protein IH614_08840, partial [Desulfuromonadales bacterium]|nr:hypothetical protein [Desulfuromonadales bacterium]
MNGRQLSLCLLLLLLAAAFLLPRPAAAVCSDLRGRATINEVYRGNPFFLEVKILDPTLNLTGWNLRVCSQNQCTNAFPVTLGRQYGPYLVFDNTNSNNQLTSTILDFSKRDLDILLTDNQGFAVDYLNINNHSVQAGACNNYPYPTTITGSSNSFSIIRDPDGNGPFVFYGTGNSEPETPGNSNKDPGGLLPKVNGSDVTVPRGAPAVFTITLSKASATPTTVSYQTVADSALSGIHFEPVTGSITFPANNTTPITVTVNTIAGSPPPDGVYFWLNLTGATGAALNTHFLRGSLVGDQGAVHHYRLQHAGNALTCQRADVTVTACQNADCSSLYTGAVIVTLTPSGWIGGDTQTFSGGSALLQLRRNTAGTVTLGISSASPGAINPRQCSGGPAGALCALTFHTSGFIFDVPNLTACQSSGNVTIQAVRTSDTTQACVADGGFANSTRAVSFWTDYQVPASGSRALTLNGTSLAGSSPGTAINLNFNGSATALFTVSYPDAGQLQLNARFTGTGEAAGLVMIGSDSFIVRPARFNVAARGGDIE